MSQLALLHPPKVLASLHALSCAGPDACSCKPIFVVHEGPAGEPSTGYNVDTSERDGIAPFERNRIHSETPSASAAIPAWRRGLSVHRGIDR